MNNLWTRWFYHPYSDAHVKGRGRRDGIQAPAIPSWESREQPPFLMEIKQAGDHDIRSLAHRWAEQDERLKADWLKLRRAADRTAAHHAAAEGALDRADARYKAVRKVDPPAGGDHRFLWYWLLLLCLMVFEFPMNAIVFRLFGENEMLTYVATGGLSLALLVGAHYLGVLLREEGPADARRRSGMVACVALPAAVALVIAYFRVVYLGHAADGSGDPAGAVTHWLDPNVSWFGFVAIGLLVYVVAAVASFMVHDHALVAVHRARKDRALARLQHERLEQLLARQQAIRERRWEREHHKAYQVRDIVQRLTELYRTHNLERRQDRGEKHETQMPRSFYEYVPVTVPPALEHLDWDAEERARPALPQALASPAVRLVSVNDDVDSIQESRNGKVHQQALNLGQDTKEGGDE